MSTSTRACVGATCAHINSTATQGALRGLRLGALKSELVLHQFILNDSTSCKTKPRNTRETGMDYISHGMKNTSILIILMYQE